MSPRVGVAVVAAVGLSLVVTATGHSQSPSGPPDTLSALLAEVRALRTTIEGVAAASASGHLALGRLQLQERRLGDVIARLESTREQLDAAQRRAVEQQEECASLEASLKDSATTAERREYVEHMLKVHRTEMVSTAADIQRLTAEESTLASQVALEQARWGDLNRRLEEIEVNLTRRR